MKQSFPRPRSCIELGEGILVMDAALPLTDAERACIPADALEGQLRAALRRIRPGQILGATLAGGMAELTPEFIPVGGVLLLKGWRAELSGIMEDFSPESLTAMLGSVSVKRCGSCTVITPSAELREDDVISRLSWIGETTRGLAVITLNNVLSAGGIRFQYRAHGAGETAFRFMAHSMEEDAELFGIVFLEETV